MDKKLSPDELIENLGGCGRFQIRLSIIVHVIKTAICWCLTFMAIATKTPLWWCVDDVISSNMTSHSNESTHLLKSCLNRNGSACKQFEFDGSIRTIVSEFDLVCDKAFIPSTVVSIQLAGMFIGNPLSGQIADLIGRKKPFFAALVLLTVFNLVGIFSNDWIMFAVCRFLIGMGAAFFLTIQYNLLSEFSLATWRPWITGFPSWAIQASVFSFVAWILLDWRYMQLACCILSALCLLSYKLVPESFRWYLSHDRHTDAEHVIKGVAKVNRHPLPDLKTISLSGNNDEDDHKKYSFLHLFHSPYLTKITFLCATNWLALGLVSYGLLFGIHALSGNIFLNLFLFQVTGIPVKCAASYLLNRIGRRKTSLICFTMTFIGGCVVGVVQYIDTDYRDELTNGFAIFANMGISAAWGSVQTMTIEMYPTVIRNIGFGSLSTIGRVGAILGPQVAFLDTVIPGIMYFVCAGLSAISIIALMFLPETKGGNLPDKIEQSERVVKLVVTKM